MRRPQTELPGFAYPRLIRTGREGQESKPPRQPSPAPRLLPWQLSLFGCQGHIDTRLLPSPHIVGRPWPGHTCNYDHMVPHLQSWQMRMEAPIIHISPGLGTSTAGDQRCRRWQFPRGILEARPNRRARANGPTSPPHEGTGPGLPHVLGCISAVIRGAARPQSFPICYEGVDYGHAPRSFYLGSSPNSDTTAMLPPRCCGGTEVSTVTRGEGMAGRRPMIEGVAVPFSLGGGTATSSMVTLNSEKTSEGGSREVSRRPQRHGKSSAPHRVPLLNP